MAAKRAVKAKLLSEKGQSLMELCFLLPAIIFLSILLVKVTVVIQMGIVNQQYARAQAFFLTCNSAIFPMLRLRVPQNTRFNQMILGVQDNPASTDSTNPQASAYKIFWKELGSDQAQAEPAQRTKVRVRSTVTMCTQSNFIGKNTEILQYDSSLKVNGNNRLGEAPDQFNFCGSPYL